MRLGFVLAMWLLLSRALETTELLAADAADGQYHAATCVRNKTVEAPPRSAGYVPADGIFRSGRYNAAFVAYYQQFFCAPRRGMNSTIWPPPQAVDDATELRATEDAFWLPSQGQCREAIPILERLVVRQVGEAELMIANCEWSLGQRKRAVHDWHKTAAMRGNPVGSDYLPQWPYEFSARSMLHWATQH